MDTGQPLLRLGSVQRQAENGGAVTLNLLTSLEYLQKTKAELSSGHVNMMERVKELQWENKCLNHERVMYGGFQSAYIYYVREMKKNLEELNRAWKREKNSSFMAMLNKSVAEHIISCQKELRKVSQKQKEEIRYYKIILKRARMVSGRFRKQLQQQKIRAKAKYAARLHKRFLIPRTRAGTKYYRGPLLWLRSSAGIKYARRPQRKSLLPKTNPTMPKPIGNSVDLSEKIVKLVEEKSELLQSLDRHYRFAKLVERCSPELVKLQNDMITEYYLVVVDGLNVNEQTFDDHLKALRDIIWWIDMNMAKIYAPETKI